MKLDFHPATRGSVLPVCPGLTAVVLCCNEERNIRRCIESVSWCEEVLVVDSGSTDGTVAIAKSLGVRVVETDWPGFAAQRNRALGLVATQWAYMVDADEWVSNALALEIIELLNSEPPENAFWQYFRLVWQGEWIRRCGWYPSARSIRLVRPQHVTYDSATGFSEHPIVDGCVGRLTKDIVDEDMKGLLAWLHKHVDYASLEVDRRLQPPVAAPPYASKLRYLIKDHVAPRLPARPLMTFIYMYFFRLGFLDGRVGLKFCLMHAWFQLTVAMVQEERAKLERAL